MAVERIHIEKFLALAKEHPVIDVRSPGEYNHAHIPGAYSMPLFSDEERKVVGTTYKQQSREKAIKVGLDYFGPKMRKMVEEAEGISKKVLGIEEEHSGKQVQIPNAKVLLIYCWRGGMRSGAVSWLLDMYGFKVYTLAGGYKSFRNYILDTFKQSYHFNIIGGYTGSGKTETLKTLQEKGATVIDLEGLANHKGSAFGNIGMPKQPTQEMFENRLGCELLAMSYEPATSKAPFWGLGGIWLEDESQRIGLVNIPHELWKTMRQSPVYFLDIPFEERLKHITEEYGQLDQQKLIEAIGRIKEKLGGLNAKTAIQLLEEGNTPESFRILLKYYDKFYFKGLHNRQKITELLKTIKCNSAGKENAELLVKISSEITRSNK